jgi:hypothetical protein
MVSTALKEEGMGENGRKKWGEGKEYATTPTIANLNLCNERS